MNQYKLSLTMMLSRRLGLADRAAMGPWMACVLFLSSVCALPAWAGADKRCNGDEPLEQCSGNDKYDSYKNHVLVSGTDPSFFTGKDQCAAMYWMSGWPEHNEEDDGTGELKLSGVKYHADIVGSEGVTPPEAGPRQAATEIQACWLLKPITGDADRPQKVRNARKPFAIHCNDNPPTLQVSLPQLIAVGQISVDPKEQKMNFFGVTLNLVPHLGARYLGITKGFAVTLDKLNGAYAIRLPSGRQLTGSCDRPPE